MGQPNSLKIQGAKELRRKISMLDGDFEDLKALNYDVAKVVADKAYNLAPLGTGKNAGRLRETIRAAGTKTGGRVRAGLAKVPYAGPIHFGWATRPDSSKGWRGGPIAPNPFLYDALDDRRHEVLDTYFRGVKTLQRKRGL